MPFSTRSVEAYERLIGRWSRVLANEFIAFTGLSDRERVLDIGCGAGSLTFALLAAASLDSVDACDTSPMFVDEVRTQAGDLPIRVALGDACDLPFETASFDRALSLLVLQFVPDTGRAVREMRRVVRPGGVVAAAVWDIFGGMPANRMLWDTATALIPSAAAVRAELFGTPIAQVGDLEAAWSAAGLNDVTATTLTVRMHHANFAEWWDPYAISSGPAGSFVSTLSGPQRDLLERHLRSAYEAGRDDGPRSFTASALACRGVVPPNGPAEMFEAGADERI
jgi:SAM-dependent methyltransferase